MSTGMPPRNQIIRSPSNGSGCINVATPVKRLESSVKKSAGAGIVESSTSCDGWDSSLITAGVRGYQVGRSGNGKREHAHERPRRRASPNDHLCASRCRVASPVPRNVTGSARAVAHGPQPRHRSLPIFRGRPAASRLHMSAAGMTGQTHARTRADGAARNRTLRRARTAMPMRNQSGFTLIELLIVTAILGILSAVAIPAVSAYFRRTKTAEARINLAKMFDSTLAYYRAEHVDRGQVDLLGTGASVTFGATHRCPHAVGAPSGGSAGFTPAI
ncbi:MAG TPA: type II secretion system protein, partial [Nannocystaceae bacterium]|nr:type II secretion system protein [Nannocystaceae bacterium]